MKIINTKFYGLKIIKEVIHYDKRGYFRETFKNNLFKNKKFIFWCLSKSKKNVIRGLHLQTKFQQEKFISVVILLKLECLKNINSYLIKVHKVLKNNFSHFEIILVNNCVHPDIRELTNELAKNIKKDIGVINLSIKINQDNAIIAGFDKANGDYTIVLDLNFSNNPSHIVDLFELSQKNYDIVYLKYKNRFIPKSKIIFYKLFYYFMNKYSDFKIDINIHESRIISRRALNAILSLRENIRYMKGIYSIVGYKTKSIEVDIPPHKPENYKKQFKSFIIAITSFTGLLSNLFLWIFWKNKYFKNW